MDMEEFFAALLEILGEVLTEAVFGLLVGFGVRATRRTLIGLRRANSLVTTLVLILLGLASGLPSVFLFPHPLVHPSKAHGVSLLISPLAAGFVMSLVGRAVSRRGGRSVQIESFRFGFTFALAVAVVRLALIR